MSRGLDADCAIGYCADRHHRGPTSGLEGVSADEETRLFAGEDSGRIEAQTSSNTASASCGVQ